MSLQQLTPQKLSHSSLEAFSAKAADSHTSQSALKVELAESIILNVGDLPKNKLGTDLVPPVYVKGCYDSIKSIVNSSMDSVTSASKEEQTYGPWVSSRILIAILSDTNTDTRLYQARGTASN